MIAIELCILNLHVYRWFWRHSVPFHLKLETITSTNLWFICTGVCSIGQHIYVVGGYDGTSQLASIERYDVLTDQWSMLAPMNIPRSAHGLAVANNKIYAIGKFFYMLSDVFTTNLAFCLKIAYLVSKHFKDNKDFKCNTCPILKSDQTATYSVQCYTPPRIVESPALP